MENVALLRDVRKERNPDHYAGSMVCAQVILNLIFICLGGSVVCKVEGCQRGGKTGGLCWSHGGGKIAMRIST